MMGAMPGRGQTGPAGLAFDLDGTLLRSDHAVSRAVAEALAQVAARGIPIVLVSARPPRSVVAIARALGLAGGMVSLNGALIADTSDSIIDASVLDAHVISGVLQVLPRYRDLTAHYYRRFDWLTTAYNDAVHRETKIIGFSPTVVSDLATIAGISKIMIVGPFASLERLEAEIADSGWAVTAHRSKPTYLEVTPSGITKAAGLAAVAKLRGLSLEDFTVFGDGDNDIPMFQACGCAVAMGNASERLKAVADVVIGTNDEDAIAQYLTENLLARTFTASPPTEQAETP